MPICSKQFTLNVLSLSDDMPLTSAIYVPSVAKIYGVRNGYLFEFDANGVSTNRSLAFADPLPGYSQLQLDPTGNLWACNSAEAYDGERFSQQGFYRFNLVTMATAQFVRFDGTYGALGVLPEPTLGGQDGGYNSGPTAFRFSSTGVINCLTMGGSPPAGGVGWYQISAGFAAVTQFTSNIGNPNSANALYWDEGTSLFWAAGASNTVMTSGALQAGSPGTWNTTNYNHGVSAFAFYGFDYVLSVDSFFISTRTPKLVLMNKTTQVFTEKDLSGSRPNMVPRMAKFVAHTNGGAGSVFLPTMTDNAVVEVNSAGTVLNVYTGFDCPFNIVDTGTKVFAVQLGKQALKLVV